MISIKNLVKIYNKGKGNEYKALKGIDFQVQDGELVAVIGKSGAGKSTLLDVYKRQLFYHSCAKNNRS